MLAISRRPGEHVCIGPYTVHVTAARAGKATLAIDAPRSVQVLRGELAKDDPLPISESMSFLELVDATLQPGFRDDKARVEAALSVAMSKLADLQDSDL